MRRAVMFLYLVDMRIKIGTGISFWKGNYFCFKDTASPSIKNLKFYLEQRGWRPTRFKSRARCSNAMLDFPEDVTQTLEAKHLLNDLLLTQPVSLMPRTYAIDFEIWPQFLAKISEVEPDHKSWILKPALMNNGQGIFLLRSLTEVSDFFCSSRCLRGPYVLQEYLQPHLLQGPEKGHKYSMRFFVVLSTRLGGFLYKEGYANIALKPYDAFNFKDLSSHLTNEHLSGERLNVIQRPVAQFPILQEFLPQIETYCHLLVRAVKEQYPEAFNLDASNHKIALLGVDFMVDQQEKLWLLEVNHGPCFPIEDSHPLFDILYRPFWETLIDLLFYADNSHNFIKLI